MALSIPSSTLTHSYPDYLILSSTEYIRSQRVILWEERSRMTVVARINKDTLLLSSYLLTGIYAISQQNRVGLGDSQYNPCVITIDYQNPLIFFSGFWQKSGQSHNPRQTKYPTRFTITSPLPPVSDTTIS